MRETREKQEAQEEHEERQRNEDEQPKPLNWVTLSIWTIKRWSIHAKRIKRKKREEDPEKWKPDWSELAESQPKLCETEVKGFNFKSKELKELYLQTMSKGQLYKSIY